MKKNIPSHPPTDYIDIKLLKKSATLQKIVITPTGEYHSFKNKDAKIDETIIIDKEFLSFDEFEKLPLQTILTYHENFFKVEPPKKQPKTLTALQCWAYMIGKLCKPHLPGTNAETGEKIRKSSIAGRKYFPGSEFGKPHGIKTFQATQCLAIFTDSIKNKESVTEEDLKALVIKRAAELKTKQDPWRIFQYYRPQLIAAKLLKCD